MLKKFQASLSKLCPDWSSKKFLIGFSGGADSTALLYLCQKIIDKKQLLAAHLNHLIRLPEAYNDQEWALKQANNFQINFATENIDIPALVQLRKKGLEEAARWARYDFFERIAKKNQCDYILTGHHANDQAETILMNLVRGAGLGGLAGIPKKRNNILRPLLNFTRNELLKLLKNENISWIEDESNNDTNFLRNKVRKNLLPLLFEINPNFLAACSRSSEILSSEEEYWCEHIKVLEKKIILSETSIKIEIQADYFEQLLAAEQIRLLGKCFRRFKRNAWCSKEPVSFASECKAIEIFKLNDGKYRDIPGGFKVMRKNKIFYIEPASRFLVIK